MGNFDRDDLIKSLASAMGMPSCKDEDSVSKRYNSSTGTLYVNKDIFGNVVTNNASNASC
ncbi:MAG: hypothetical protein K6A23_13990 [Butyrivibrio sp.]|nr:hypothetical protein [Butyrivibrio sp.]